jgi:hypothetical protein
MKKSELRQLIKEEISKVLNEKKYNLNKAFAESPNEASYSDILSIFGDYDDDDILGDFKLEFPKGKPISKINYNKFAMSLIDDMADADYVKANWISLFDDEVFEKAGLV